MDEREFKAQFSKKSVFKQISSLDLSYVPQKLYCRDDAISRLIYNFRRIVEELEQPSINCLILGKGGVGKTVTAKYFGRNFKTIAIEKDVNVFVEYYNCIEFRSKSKIIRDMLSKYCHGSGRGFSDDEMIKQILTKLIYEKGYILLIIDEVHMLKPEDILGFLDITEIFGHQNAKLSLLLISRSKDWMRIENERILSRLNDRIKLNEYTFDEALKILKYRSELAFCENIVSDNILEMVSQIVAEHKNMRHGIEILRRSGLYADKEGLSYLTPEIIREASNDVYPTFRSDVIDQLEDHELLTLLGIAQALINKGEPFALVEDAYDEYRVLCERFNLEIHVKMSFTKHIRNLKQLKVVSTKNVQIEESKRGRHLEITLLDIPAVKLRELLENFLDKKLAK